MLEMKCCCILLCDGPIDWLTCKESDEDCFQFPFIEQAFCRHRRGTTQWSRRSNHAVVVGTVLRYQVWEGEYVGCRLVFSSSSFVSR